MKKLSSILFATSVAIFGWLPSAGAMTYSQSWAGATVSVTYPDKVVYNTAFDVSFAVDSSTMPNGGAIAFLSTLSMSNTVDLSSATWSYVFNSDDPVWNWNLTGAVGDFYAPLTTTGSGYSIAFGDPVTYPYTWVLQPYNDELTWTVHDIVILGDTTFSLLLDDDNYVVGPIEAGFIVLDPPAVIASPVPEPSTLWSLLLGLGALSARRVWKRAKPG